MVCSCQSSNPEATWPPWPATPCSLGVVGLRGTARPGEAGSSSTSSRCTWALQSRDVVFTGRIVSVLRLTPFPVIPWAWSSSPRWTHLGNWPFPVWRPLDRPYSTVAQKRQDKHLQVDGRGKQPRPALALGVLPHCMVAGWGSCPLCTVVGRGLSGHRHSSWQAQPLCTESPTRPDYSSLCFQCLEHSRYTGCGVTWD